MTKRRIRFTRSQVQRAKRLLHMRYRPAELAGELGCSVHLIYRRYIPAGCPCEHDGGGHLWIVGDVFRDWMLLRQREAVADGRAKIGKGQAYCVVCEKGVDVKGPLTARPVSAHLELVQGQCTECGAIVCRGQRRVRRDDSQTELP